MYHMSMGALLARCADVLCKLWPCCWPVCDPKKLRCYALQVRSARHTDSDTESLHDARQRTAPEEGARDLAVIEALLQSSQMDGKAVQVKDIPVAS